MKEKLGLIILLIVLAVVMVLLLELGKHTLLGWFLAAAVFAGYIYAYDRVVAAQPLASRVGIFVLFLALLFVVLRVSWPSIRFVPAIDGENGGKTEIVQVEQGELQGVYTADKAVEVYAGIPYAAPPVNELRWQPPQPAKSWEGVRSCDTFGPMSMQQRTNTVLASLTEIFIYHTYKISLKDNWIAPMSEDSLYLNVWKPAGELENAPVLVYVHGGSLSTGQPWYSEYNGEGLARRGVIVVNFAYRLNVFGYYADQTLLEADGTTGNYGLLDQIAALEWVQKNIAAFGGDPDNVTLCGESAGASSVNALCCSPLAKGLFRRAIAESSGMTPKVPYHTFRSLDDAIRTGNMIRNEFDAKDVDALRAVDAVKLVQTKHTNDSMTVDGYALTEQPWLTYEKGENHEEALLNGFNVHEADLFSMFKKVTAENYVETVEKTLHERAEAAVALYPAAEQDPAYRYLVDLGGSAKGSYDSLLSAIWFGYSHYDWSRRVAAEGRPVWEYYFTKDNGSLGSNHGGELPYAFGNLHRHAWLYDGADEALSETMMKYYVNFIKTGDPNGDGLPAWESVNDAPGQVLELGETVGMIEDPHLALYPILDEDQEARWAEISNK